MSLSTVLQVNSIFKTVIGNTGDVTELVVPVQWTLNAQRTWPPATGAGGVTVEWPYAFTLSGSTVDFDLTSLVSLVAGAANVTLAKVRVIGFEASEGNVADLILQPSSPPSNPWAKPFTGPFTASPGQKFLIENPSAAGWPVSGGSKVLRVSGTVGDSFKIYLGGE